MAFFNGFQRKAVVIVPTDEEAKVRTEKRIREEGKDVPDSAVMEMKANFKIPSVDDTFSEVEFPVKPAHIRSLFQIFIFFRNFSGPLSPLLLSGKGERL